MLGHCAGLRNTQKLGDYVLAHGYVREDHVLDAELPVWVPLPALAEVQVALEQAVGEVTGFVGYELKRIKTASVAKISKASGMPSPNLAPGSSAWRPARDDWPAVDLKLVGLRGGSDE